MLAEITSLPSTARMTSLFLKNTVPNVAGSKSVVRAVSCRKAIDRLILLVFLMFVCFLPLASKMYK